MNIDRKNISDKNIKNNNTSFLSKLKSFIKVHPYIFSGIIAGVAAVTIVTVVTCVVLTRKDNKEVNEVNEITLNDDVEEEVKIFPLEENSKQKVMGIYGNIGSNDAGTLEAFCTYLGEISTDLVEEQKVYLAHKWIVDNINYDYTGRDNNNAIVDPQQVFESSRLTVCSGYSFLFRKLLLCMNYQENKIKVISGYSKGSGYSPYTPPRSNHAWNAVEINGKWCLIDTTWDENLNTEYYLCLPPRCFVRDHLPENDDKMQFLKNPITVEQFHEQVETEDGFCKYNVKIIEDKGVQNICGKTKVTLKYNYDFGGRIVSLDVSALNDVRVPDFFITRIENGFEIDISVNEAGISQFFLLMSNEQIGQMHFICDEEPTEKTYYPHQTHEYRVSDAKLIRPIQEYLNIGEKYTFEITTSVYNKMKVRMDSETAIIQQIPMTKNGNTFIKEDVTINSGCKSLYLLAGDNDDFLISYELIES